MTAETFHDILTALPEDLVAAADARRTAPKTILPFRRYAAMAACFALVLTCSLFCLRLVRPKGAVENAAGAPAEMMLSDAAPAPVEDQILGTGQTNDTVTNGHSGAGEPEAAAPESVQEEAPAGDMALAASGTLTVIRCSDGGPVSVSAESAALLQRLLSGLAYDPQAVCNCLAEYRIQLGEDTWELNLTEGFVRTGAGQALLTADQNRTLSELLENPLP